MSVCEGCGRETTCLFTSLTIWWEDVPEPRQGLTMFIAPRCSVCLFIAGNSMLEEARRKDWYHDGEYVIEPGCGP